MVIQGVSYPSDFEAKKQMTEIGRRMEEKGYLIAEDGSLSVRVGPNAVWLTAEGADKGALKQEHFIRVDMNGKQSPGSRQTRLPEDTAVHLALYSQNPALRGVIHGYPAGAAVFAAQGREVPAADFTPSVRRLGRVSLIPPGTAEETARASALVCKTDSGVLISGNGCMMWGESLTEAFHKIQALEYCVKVSSMMGCAAAPREIGTEPMRTTAPMQAAAPMRTTVPMQAAAPMLTTVPVRETAPVSAGTSSDFSSEEIEGLTPIIRPGDGCSLPADSAAAPTNFRAASSGMTSFAAAPPAPTSSGQTVTDAASRREQMMAEVVRRSLASL